MSTAVLLPNGKQAFLNAAGTPAVGCKLQTWAAGTSTPKTTWQDSAEGAANTNPIILDARGEAVIFWDGAYKIQLQDPTGAPLWAPIDNVTGIYPGSASLVPTTDNAFDLGSAAFAWRNLYLGANHAALLDPTTGNIGYWARTAAEIAAAVTPTIYFFPPGDVRRYGADATGAASSASAFQQASSANKSVWMPEGVYKIDGQVNCGTRPVCFSGASRGSVTLNLSTAVDAFKWTAAFVTGAGFRHAVLDLGSMTGGFALSIQGQNRIVINDLTIRTTGNAAGAIYLEDINAIGLRDIWGNANFGTNGAFIKAVGTTATSFNVLDLDNIQYGGTGGAASTSSDFLVLEGGVNTVDMRHCGAVACRYGIITTNPGALATFGEFIDATDTQFDGLYGTAVILGTTGAGTTGTHYFNQLYIHNSGANNVGVTAVDGHGMYIYPNCREASFQGGVIVTCKLNGVYNDGNGIRFSDFKISKNSQLAVGTYPGFQFGPSSYECKVFDCMIGQHTGSSSSDMSYGLQFDLGSARNTATNNTLFLNTLGPILNNSGDVNTQIQNNLYGGNMTFSPALGPAAMGATVNNYNPANWSINVKRLRLTPAAGDTTINGLFTGVGATTWTDGTTLLLQNLSAADNVKLAHLNGGSNAWNQFSLPSAATLTIPPLGTQQITYDGILSKWIKA